MQQQAGDALPLSDLDKCEILLHKNLAQSTQSEFMKFTWEEGG